MGDDMEVRTFRAKSMQEALGLVRRELGPGAAVLHTREVGTGGLLRLFPRLRKIEVTASTGVAEVMGKEEIHTTLARADMNLYVAKANGRNRVFPASLDQTPLARAQSSGSETAPQ